MKKILSLLLIVFFAVTMLVMGIGCKTETAEETKAAEETAAEETAAADTTAEVAAETGGTGPLFTYSLVKSGAGPFGIWHWDSFIAACKDAGARYVLYDAAASNIEIQMQQLEEAISVNPDVYLFEVIEPKVVIPVLKKAYEAGMKIIPTFATVDEEGWPYITAFVMGSGLGQGKAAAEAMYEGMTKKFGDDLTGRKVVILFGQVGHPSAIERTDGFKERMKELAPGVEILDEQSCEWDKATGMKIMEGWLATYPQIDGVFGNNDGGALGALEAAEEKGRLDEVIIVGIDGVEEAMIQIESGKMYGTILQSAEELCRMAVDLSMKIYNGEEVPFTNLIPNPIITKENVEQYKR
jgi:ABC-type sugar transport system substrate-binding protein